MSSPPRYGRRSNQPYSAATSNPASSISRRHSIADSQCSSIAAAASPERTDSRRVRLLSSQSARSKIPGSRSSQSPCVCAMSSRLGANTSNTSCPPGSRRVCAARSALSFSASSGMWRSDRNGQITSGTRSSTGGLRRSPRRRSTSEATPCSSASARATASMQSERSTPITESPACAIGTAIRPDPTASSTTGPPQRLASPT